MVFRFIWLRIIRFFGNGCGYCVFIVNLLEIFFLVLNLGFLMICIFIEGKVRYVY